MSNVGGKTATLFASARGSTIRVESRRLLEAENQLKQCCEEEKEESKNGDDVVRLRGDDDEVVKRCSKKRSRTITASIESESGVAGDANDGADVMDNKRSKESKRGNEEMCARIRANKENALRKLLAKKEKQLELLKRTKRNSGAAVVVTDEPSNPPHGYLDARCALNALMPFGGKGVPIGGSVLEVYGKAGSGKTQLLFTLAALACCEKPDASVLFIDTDGTFRGKRVQSIVQGSLEREGSDEKSCARVASSMGRIKVARVKTAAALVMMVEKRIPKLVASLERSAPVKLVIVDSIISLFGRGVEGSGTIGDLYKVMKGLKAIANSSGTPPSVIIANQVSADFERNDAVKPKGGRAVSTHVSVRFHLKKSKMGCARMCFRSQDAGKAKHIRSSEDEEKLEEELANERGDFYYAVKDSGAFPFCITGANGFCDPQE